MSAPSPAEAYAAQPPDQAPTAMRGPQRPQQSFPSMNSLRAAVEPPTPSRSPVPGTDVPMTPQEQARRMRHQAVTDRAFFEDWSLRSASAAGRAYRCGTLRLARSRFTILNSPSPRMRPLAKTIIGVSLRPFQRRHQRLISPPSVRASVKDGVLYMPASS